VLEHDFFAAMFTAYNEHQGQGGHPQMHPSLQQPPPQQQPQQVPQVPQDVLMKLLELQQQQVRPGTCQLGVRSLVCELHIKKTKHLFSLKNLNGCQNTAKMY
jgi:hypothetical protein